MKIIVLAKQVPDTRSVGKDAMTPEGTVNRGALEAIFNPEDLNALEQALRLKAQVADSTVKVLTMGPARAADIIREAIFRGADGGYLLTDRAFAGADTLATSYALAKAIEHLGGADLILSGRQAIDGDTAQVGPQVAEKTGLLQVTYAEEIRFDGDQHLIVNRRLEHGVETVRCPLPVLITVNGSAAASRPRNAKRVQQYKFAQTKSELSSASAAVQEIVRNRPNLIIEELNVQSINADPEQCGLSGSPTKVKTIVNVVFQAKESKRIEPTDEAVNDLMIELIANHTIG